MKCIIHDIFIPFLYEYIIHAATKGVIQLWNLLQRFLCYLFKTSLQGAM